MKGASDFVGPVLSDLSSWPIVYEYKRGHPYHKSRFVSLSQLYGLLTSHCNCLAVEGGTVPDGAGVYAVFNKQGECEYVGLSRKVS